MGRRKTYERETIAARAMELFWLHGFHGVSTQALVEHMNVNRYSLYAEFGSKQGLYEAALALYEERVVTSHFARLEGPDAGLAELRWVFDFFASAARTPGSERGCFLCNVATERGPHDPASQGFVAAYLDRISDAIQNALQLAQASGDVRADVDVAEEAQLLASTLVGFFVLLRSQVEPSIMRGAARAAVRHIDSLTGRIGVGSGDSLRRSSDTGRPDTA